MLENFRANVLNSWCDANQLYQLNKDDDRLPEVVYVTILKGIRVSVSTLLFDWKSTRQKNTL